LRLVIIIHLIHGLIVLFRSVVPQRPNAISRLEWFKQAADVTKVAQGADERTLQLVVQGDLAQIIQIAGQHSATNIATHEPSLEEAFLRFYEPQQQSSALAG